MPINNVMQLKLIAINSKLVVFAFVTIVLFQITVYKNIWGMEYFSRLLNIAFCVVFSAYALYAIVLKSIKINKNVFIFYIIPGLLVYVGYFINITITLWLLLSKKIIGPHY